MTKIMYEHLPGGFTAVELDNIRYLNSKNCPGQMGRICTVEKCCLGGNLATFERVIDLEIWCRRCKTVNLFTEGVTI